MRSDFAEGSVGRALGLDDREYPATYVPGSEPSSSARRKRSPWRAEPVDPRLLDPLAEHALAGVSDATLARVAHVTTQQVALWRRARGIHKRAGRPGRIQHATTMAVELFGEPFQPVVAQVAHSPVLGRFEPPEYVIRHGLDYAVFARFVRELNDAGHDANELAAGFGVRDLDIAMALALTRPEAA